jgi:hypothetical protein
MLNIDREIRHRNLPLRARARTMSRDTIRLDGKNPGITRAVKKYRNIGREQRGRDGAILFRQFSMFPYKLTITALINMKRNRNKSFR